MAGGGPGLENAFGGSDNRSLDARSGGVEKSGWRSRRPPSTGGEGIAKSAPARSLLVDGVAPAQLTSASTSEQVPRDAAMAHLTQAAPEGDAIISAPWDRARDPPRHGRGRADRRPGARRG